MVFPLSPPPPPPPPPPPKNSHLGGQVEVMNLTAASQRDRLQHQQLLLDLEAKKKAFSVDVPTLPNDVRVALRNLGLPVRLFGENLANVRDRLRLELARREVMKERGLTGQFFKDEVLIKALPKEDEEEEEITKYSRATPELIRAREQFAKYSLERAKLRLDKERNRRVQWQRKRVRLSPHREIEGHLNNVLQQYELVTKIDDECLNKYKTIKKMGLEGSQYGDGRPLSCIGTTSHSIGQGPLIATGSWSGTIKLWDGSSPNLAMISLKPMAHEDRIMGIAVRPQAESETSNASPGILATASIDLTAKLWKFSIEENNGEGHAEIETQQQYRIEEIHHLKGHARRLCRVAFHPQARHIGTTSFDHTWRLWDVETGSEILLQDGHWKEVYGIAFHGDGSLCSTSDYGSVVQVWDLRSGKSIHHFLGHAKRVLCTEFSPNGFQLATAGDDGTIKVWDLRKRKQFASIPAHSNLVTQLRFDRNSNGEYLVSSSFDATVKVWSTRDWNILTTLRGHEGKVMGIDLMKDNIVTCGYDKTLKLWG